MGHRSKEQQHTSRRGFMAQGAAALMGAVSFPYVLDAFALGKAGTVAPSNRIVVGGDWPGRHGAR